ncbi:LOW QUALITY PROTEIN: fibroblast growth factor-binding protein 3-like [Empidonax traillii]|uniref:LOW QUALITY PROTEIN: fibroblast growth factor-binding protein 3-like n=1 Tax=Empidonax traillii TaxID=164674 RepID=UPI000FFD4A01|nr:LOW QUALITY PROTEIN: fibroblast growth factor-binding protein 3-like [Empidonax traillii]
MPQPAGASSRPAQSRHGFPAGATLRPRSHRRAVSGAGGGTSALRAPLLGRPARAGATAGAALRRGGQRVGAAGAPPCTVRVSAGRGGCGGTAGPAPELLVAEAPRRLPRRRGEDAAGAAGPGRPGGRRRRRGEPGRGAGGPVLHAGAAAVPLGAALGAGASELLLSCRAAGGGAARSCTYRGEPRRCPAYGTRSHQYWRQILSRLRRRLHPCAPGAPLSARLCGPGRAPPEAQLRLLPDPGPATPAPAPQPTEDPAETYCAERWHSLCSFFVGFWEG